jgi:hypothetical protein
MIFSALTTHHYMGPSHLSLMLKAFWNWISITPIVAKFWLQMPNNIKNKVYHKCRKIARERTWQWTRDSRFEVRGSRFEIRDARSEIRDSRFEIRDPRSEIRDSRFEIRDSRFEIRDPRFEIRGSRFEVSKRCRWPLPRSISKIDTKLDTPQGRLISEFNIIQNVIPIPLKQNL